MLISCQLSFNSHAIPTVILWFDFLFLSPPFSEKSRPWLLSVLLTSAYTSWMEYCAQKNGNCKCSWDALHRYDTSTF